MKKSYMVKLGLFLTVALIALLLATSVWAKTTIRFYIKDQHQGDYPKLVELFKQKHPGSDIDIKVEVGPATGTGGDPYYQKFLVMMAGGDVPDIVLTGDIIVGQFVPRNAYLDLQPLINRDNYDLSGFIQSGVDNCTNPGGAQGIFCLPYEPTGKAMFYNRKIFDEVGISYPDKSWDWNRTLEAAKKMVKMDSRGRVTRFGYATNPMWWGQIFGWIDQNGGHYLTQDMKKTLIDEPAAIEAIQWHADMMTVHKVSPTPSLNEQEPRAAMLVSGKVGMAWGTHYDIPAMKDNAQNEWAVAYLPKGKNSRGYFLWLHSFAIPTMSKNPDEAWEVLKFFVSPDLPVLGSFTPARPAMFPLWLEKQAEFADKDVEIFLQSMDDGFVPQTTPTFYEQIDVLTQDLDAVWEGRKTAAEAVREIVPKINKLLERKL